MKVNSGKFWAAVSLASALCLVGCTGPDTELESGEDASGDAVVEDVGDDGAIDEDSDSQDSDADDVEAGPDCIVEGFEQSNLVGTMYLDDGKWKLQVGSERADGRLALLVLDEASGHAEVGTHTFQGFPLTEMKSYLIIGEGCDQGACSTQYISTEGTIEITQLERVEYGTVSATLRDVVLTEVGQGPDGYMARIPDPNYWCVEEAEIVGNVDMPVEFDVTCAVNEEPFVPEGDMTVEMGEDGGWTAIAKTSNEPYWDQVYMVATPQRDGAATTVGTYMIDDWDLLTCSNCVVLGEGCDDTGCFTRFMAGEAVLEITNLGGVGEQFTATLLDAKFQEVDIDSETAETRLIESGRDRCIDRLEWDVEITASP